MSAALPVVEPTLIATPEQRRRAIALALMCVGVTALGVLVRVAPRGDAPAPCPTPALQGGLLVCDGQGEAPGARAWLAGERLDVNRATKSELEAIPGVGPSLAGAIVDAREERGGFSSWDELDQVPGVGPKTLAKLARYLRVAQPR